MRTNDLEEYKVEDKAKHIEVNLGKWFFIGFAIIILVIGLFTSVYTVGAGERGVLLTFQKPSDIAVTEGLHFKVPIAQSVVIMDVKTQKYEAKASAASKDLQTVSTEVTINYQILESAVPEIYRTIGLTYEDKIIQPAVQEVVKASTAQYTAEELITKRAEVKDKIDIALRDKLSTRSIVVQEILITNFDFSASFNQAIEQKVTAEQNALAAKNKLAQVKYEAEQRIAQATAEAEAIKIQASAIQAQGGQEYVQLQAIGKWDGKLSLVSGGNSMPFINFNQLTTNTSK